MTAFQIIDYSLPAIWEPGEGTRKRDNVQLIIIPVRQCCILDVESVSRPKYIRKKPQQKQSISM